MRGLAFGTKTDLHGIQCAVATSICAGLYEKVRKITPDQKEALEYAARFDYAKYGKELKAFIGRGADAMIALEAKEGKYDKAKHAARLEVILAKWGTIQKIVAEEIPEKAAVDAILEKIGAPKTVAELGIEGDLFTVFAATKDIRDKYVLSRLLWDIGEIEEIFKSADVR